LSVQPLVSPHVAAFFGLGELHRLQHELGSEELAGAVSQLQAAGVSAISHVRVGRRAETIASLARELGCETILMGQDDHPGVVDRLFGSVAEQVRHLLGPAAGRYQVIGT
jgi:nucleotide-binding universal stress UspA family protein